MVLMEDDGKPSRESRLLRAALDEFLERTRGIADFVASTGGGAIGAVPAVLPPAVTGMVSSFQRLAERLPAPTAQLDMFVQEIRAKRAIVRALMEQLEAFEQQLDVLEKSLEPLQSWSHQWGELRTSVLDAVRHRDGTGAAESRED
ncbi:MAG: hypothetical protein ACLGIA_06635 [Actinomycetes bacterium]